MGAQGTRARFRLDSLPDVCELPHGPTRDFIALLRHLSAALMQSPTGRALLRAGRAGGLTVGIDPLLRPSTCFFYPSQTHIDFGWQASFVMAPEKLRARYFACLTGGLRRFWHQMRGCGADSAHEPEDFLRQFRAAEADVAAVTHLIAWELRADGETCLWRQLLGSENGDIALVFERAIANTPAASFSHPALAAAFHQWFADSGRVNACDTDGLEILDMAMLMTDTASAPAAAGEVERCALLGLLPQGGNYLTGRHFGGTWYDGLRSAANRIRLTAIAQERAAVFAKSGENIGR